MSYTEGGGGGERREKEWEDKNGGGKDGETGKGKKTWN